MSLGHELLAGYRRVLPACNFDSRVWPLTTGLLQESQTVFDLWSAHQIDLLIYSQRSLQAGPVRKDFLEKSGKPVCLKGWVGRREEGQEKRQVRVGERTSLG